MLINGNSNMLYAPKTPGAFGGLSGFSGAGYDKATKYGGVSSLVYYTNILGWIKENNPSNVELGDFMQKYGIDDDDLSNAYGMESFKAIKIPSHVETPFDNNDVYSGWANQAEKNAASIGLTIDDLEFAAGQASNAANEAAAAAAQRQDDEVAQAAARAAAAYAAQAQALNEVIFSAGTATAKENAMIADIYTQAAEDATVRLENAINTSDEETNAANAALKASEAAAMIAQNVQNAAETVVQKSNAFVKETKMLKLPANFTNYTAAQKIEYFNDNYIDERMLLAEGVSQDDINWMKQNGYTGMPAEPIFEPDPEKTGTGTGTGTTKPTNTALPLILAAAAAYFIGG